MNGKNGFSNGKQCNWITDNHGKIEFHYHGAGQSLGPEIRSRILPALEPEIEAFCLGRGITKSDFARDYMELGPAYYDHIQTLKEEAQFFIPLLKNREARELIKRLAKELKEVCRTESAE